MISSRILLVLFMLHGDQAAIIRSTYPKYEGCSGWINSPDFPLPLDEEAYINYSVEVPDQHTVKLELVRLEMRWAASCTQDRLTIHDGDNAQAPLIANLCGYDNGQVKSSGRNAFIHFHTSRATFGFSFLMRYTSVPEPGASKPCPLTMPPSDGCDGGLKVIRKASGVITSPGYPLPYPPNLNCLYGIDVSEFGSEISIYWNDLELGNDPECRANWLKLYDSYDARSMGPYCYYKGRPKFKEYLTPIIYVKFRSDRVTSGRGFELKFSADGKPAIVAATSTYGKPAIVTASRAMGRSSLYLDL